MKLYDYQTQYIEGLPPSCIMAAGLGTGKTLMSLAHWQRQQTARPLLVVAPAAKIRTLDWQGEAERWFSDAMPDITYISYERLRLMDNNTKRPRWWQYTGARNGGVVYDVIADECHSLKNPQSKQSKAIYEISKSGGLFIGLSGTPMPNGWIDFAGYSKLFNYTRGITEFKQKYCRIVDYKGFPEIVGYNNTEELQRQLDYIAYRLTAEQASKLPSRQMIGVNITLPKKLTKKYYEYKLTRMDKVTGEVFDNSSRLLSVLRQTTTEGRLDHLLSVVNDTNDNIVVFYNYISERKAILKLLKQHTDKHILRYDGEQHDKLPASDAKLSDTVLVAHYKSASTGLNLQWANITVMFSPTYSYQDFEQSIGRTHRTGQTKRCVFYLFNVKNTVDRDVWDCLKDKRSFQDKLWISNT
jgi:SNF2 family DNA or RNA helicase